MDKHLLELLNKTLDAQLECIKTKVENEDYYDGKPRTIAQVTENMAKQFIFYNIIKEIRIHVDASKSQIKKVIKDRLIDKIDLLRKYGMVK